MIKNAKYPAVENVVKRIIVYKKESIEIVFLRLLLIKNISGKRTEYRSKAIKHTGKEQG